MEITDKVPAAGGKRCLQYNLKAGQKSSGGLFRLLKPWADKIVVATTYIGPLKKP